MSSRFPEWGGSSTTLDAEAEFESPLGQALSRDTAIVGSVFADKEGVLHIEQGSDGENWDVDAEYEIGASDGKGFSETVVARYWRVRFVNGEEKQGAFRISYGLRG